MPPELYGYHSRGLIDFFLKLKSHRLPVSIKEYWLSRTALEQKGRRNRSAVKVWDQRAYRNLDDSVNSAHAISRSL
jgi:uncharacterized protein with von Willebrand factor type A (vWA) domain